MHKALRAWHMMSASEMLAFILHYSFCKIYAFDSEIKAWENSQHIQPPDKFLSSPLNIPPMSGTRSELQETLALKLHLREC